ncbi:MAG: hypothetical protein DWQ34_14520 [Planctomycetota bacterium]|nr:MAG: hypothetical protein DWQ34_14520 [Planctomycetota bacterium]REK19978.1 MAG: hypothetical protein DWQ41_27030 [Planctomycetota bacterium]REK27545.1 MAG: hypothetical protein DWQ45_26050 [Planctomycetota bacterium]
MCVVDSSVGPDVPAANSGPELVPTATLFGRHSRPYVTDTSGLEIAGPAVYNPSVESDVI